MSTKYKKPQPYWKSDKSWYTVDLKHGVLLTESAPPKARRSFEEWQAENRRRYDTLSEKQLI